MMSKKILFLCLLLPVLPLSGQSFNAASLGLGFSDQAVVRGSAALDRNPANLAYAHYGEWELNIFSFNLGLSNSSFSLADYNRYFTDEGHGGTWTESDKKDIIDRFPEEGLNLISRAGMNVLGATYGPFGFSMDFVADASFNFKSRKATELLLLDTRYDLDFTFSEKDFLSGEGYTAIRYNFAYGQKIDIGLRRYDIDDFAVGGRLRIYQGLAVFDVKEAAVEVKRFNSDVTPNGSEILYYTMNGRANRAYVSSSASAGSGISLDLAASAAYDDDWRFSFLLENFIGSISWDQNGEEYLFTRSDSAYVFEDDAPDRVVEQDTAIARSEITTPLPAAMSFSAAYQMDNQWRFMATYRQGLSNRFSETTTPLLGVAAQYNPIPLLPLRMGMIFGGLDEFILTTGLGLHGENILFDISYAMRESVWPTASNGIYWGMGLRIRI